MASWKKVIVSGSNANLTAVQVDGLTLNQVVIGGGSGSNLTTTAINGTGNILATTGSTGVIMSGSFSGSFQGNFDGTAATASFVTASGVYGPYGSNSVISSSYSVTSSFTTTAATASYITGSNVFGPYGSNSVISASHAVQAASTAGTLVFGEGLEAGSFNGSGSVTLTVSGAAQLTGNAITKWDDTANKFVVSSLTDDGTTVSGTTSIQLTGASSKLTGSFTGSFTGDGSGLTGLVSTLKVSGSTYAGQPYTSGSVSLLTQGLIIQGTQNEVDVDVANQTVTIGLPNDVTVSNNLTVTGDLTVNGTTTTINTTNLLVEDKFILLSSGSTASNDGGIIVQSAAAGTGFAYGYDETSDRWVFQDALAGTATAFGTITAYSTTTEYGTAASKPSDATGPAYGGASAGYGNQWVSTDTGEIWIYS